MKNSMYKMMVALCVCAFVFANTKVINNDATKAANKVGKTVEAKETLDKPKSVGVSIEGINFQQAKIDQEKQQILDELSRNNYEGPKDQHKVKIDNEGEGAPEKVSLEEFLAYLAENNMEWSNEMRCNINSWTDCYFDDCCYFTAYSYQYDCATIEGYGYDCSECVECNYCGTNGYYGGECPAAEGASACEGEQGCTDASAENFSSTAVCDDGSCTWNGGCGSSSQCGSCCTNYCCDGSSEFGNAGWGADCSDGSDEGAQCCDSGYSAYGDCAALEDCNGDFNGGAVLDACGVCNGDGSSCACDDLTVCMTDSYGDGWNGNTLTIGTWSGANDGSTEGGEAQCVTACIDMSLANEVTCGNGSWMGEVSWTISDADGNLIAEGGAPYIGCIGTGCPVYGCMDPNAPQYDASANIDDGSCAYAGQDCSYYGSFPENYTLNCSLTSCYDYVGNGWTGDGWCDASTACDAYDCDGGDCSSDCEGTCNGSATVDCNGDCGGSAVLDDCGVCNGDGSSCACDDLTVVVNDSYGDGWSGQVLSIGPSWSSNGPTDGSSETLTVCIDMSVANDVVVTSGSWNGEVSWSISDAAGNELASGGAPYGGCIGTGCPVYGCTLSGADNYNPEASLDDGSCNPWPGAEVSYWNPDYPGSVFDCNLAYYLHDHDNDGIVDTAQNGVCDNAPAPYDPGYGPNTACAAFDCDGGDCLDCYGECGGSATVDCNGDCGGSAVLDDCGNCNGDCVETVIQEGSCVNDDSIADQYGDTCSSWYDTNGGCGNWDTADFIAADLCCACGGGDITEAVTSISCGDGSCDCDGNVDAGCGCGEAGPSGCDSVCGSSAEDDCCGVCDGDGSSCAGNGDTNGDGDTNVNDIVTLVSQLVNGTSNTACGDSASDSNGDGQLNVLDVIVTVDAILGGGLARTDVPVPTSVELIQSGHVLSYIGDVNGLVGFEMTLYHDGDCEFSLTQEAHIADYHTSGNITKMIIVTEGSNTLFSSTGDFEIVDVMVGNAESAINAVISIVPEVFGLSTAYPNPFNPVTSFELAMPADGFVSVKVYNLMGQVIATLHEGNLSAKLYSFSWDASNAASGMYFLQAESAGQVDIQKIMLMK